MRRQSIIVCLILVISSYVNAFAINRSKLEEIKGLELTFANNTDHHSFIILGATGDLARREIYPALWYLYRDELLPATTVIYGFARSPMTIDELRERIEPYVDVKPEEEELYEKFWTHNRDVIGSKDQIEGYNTLCKNVKISENGEVGNRIFYMALPPSAFKDSADQVKRACMADNGWTRLVIEKPFGRDSETSESLSKHISKLFSEDQIYRIDHFLGYEMVQNLLALRFGNRLLSAEWNRDNIASVEVDFKENFGIEGRGAFFDENGIIRDVMQNHLLQIMSLIAMEKPKSSHTDDVRDEKVRLLKSTKNIVLDDVVLGQYVGNRSSLDPREHLGYTEEPSVENKQSLQSTFALTVLKVDNERWRGVPFIIRAGKGLNINQTKVIIQFKDVEKDLFDGESKRNKLVIGIEKEKSIVANIMSKTPGYSHDIEEISVDFNYDSKYKDLTLPNAYERLILDVFHGSQLNFVRSDELREAWRIFTPILHKIEDSKIRPLNYTFGTTGPKEADELERKYNFL